MDPRRKTLFLIFFLILVIDLSSFTLIYTYPQVITEYLINYFGPEGLGLAIVGGFITAIVASMVLLLIFYREIRVIVREAVKELK